jgi:uncharacterized glyoxalase superfamily protein PhnB
MEITPYLTFKGDCEAALSWYAYRDIAAAHDFLVRAFGFDSGGVGARDPEGHRWWFSSPVKDRQ